MALATAALIETLQADDDAPPIVGGRLRCAVRDNTLLKRLQCQS
ncbi:hypothetical protein SAMN05444166_7867 [Singulisphaera sp. GP187]|nr:hypothetical protein SAMN05444166_7867 [Singulisphaera sp. GP187]